MSNKLLTLLLALACCAILPALAQSNPPLTACGLPAGGAILSSVTYTLSSDCVLSGQIVIASADPKISVTINGGGYSISGGSNRFIFGPDAILNLNDATIDGGGLRREIVISVGTVNANRVTFKNGFGGPVLSGKQTNLNNALFSGNDHTTFALGGNGSAIHARPNSSYVLTDVVFRNNFRGGGAVTLLSGSTLATKGCLTLSGNVPYDIYEHGGTWTDNSAGPCAGTIGNGDQAVIPAPRLMDCGFPEAGNLDASATYVLSADCELTGITTISEHVAIRVIGNGYAIRTSRSGYSVITAATSSLRMENVALEAVRILHYGDFRADRIRASDATNGIMVNMGEARFSNALFENNISNQANVRSVLLAYNAYQNGFTSFTDSAFRNNSGGLGPLQNVGATIELNGCVIFEGNSPDNWREAVTDNRDPNCGSIIIDPLAPPSKTDNSDNADDKKPRFHPSIGSRRDLSNCDLPLGAIGLICRPKRQPPSATVWRVRPESEGIFLYGVTQAQVEAATEGIVACSEDGRSAVRVGLTDELLDIFSRDPSYREELKIPRRYIIISKGPTEEGKVHHVVLDHVLDGHVFGTVDTFGDPPATDCPPPPHLLAWRREQQNRLPPKPSWRRWFSPSRRKPMDPSFILCGRAIRPAPLQSPIA